ncbi:hypothetical protein IW261DRAFT_889885 [Armillaria novae-zelandiae]|uniref:Secreted protein n=1 Tax=Armillaria novae-zelandiae TaxID=153914 RepID=A0AA39PJV3_9AGAR|nr:hypothetical protein IW261DRAFT_889885 [Armillaria novae-zelandiae]
MFSRLGRPQWLSHGPPCIVFSMFHICSLLMWGSASTCMCDKHASHYKNSTVTESRPIRSVFSIILCLTHGFSSRIPSPTSFLCILVLLRDFLYMALHQWDHLDPSLAVLFFFHTDLSVFMRISAVFDLELTLPDTLMTVRLCTPCRQGTLFYP